MNFDNLQLNDPRITDDCKQEFRLRVGRSWPTAGELEPFAAIWAMAFLFGQGQQSDVQPEAVQVPLCVRTAPERIWLQADINGMRADDPFENDGVTWCAESVGGAEVEYVRADLAAPQPPAQAKSEVEDLIAECIPGGSVCDPQEVADNIRRYCNAWPDPAQAEARGDEPELGSHEVNEAAWAFVEAMPHSLPGPIWNNVKPAVRAAICKYLKLTRPAPAAPQAGELEDAKKALADQDRLVRELDVLINGEEGAAKQASLCDIVSQVAASQPMSREANG